MDGRLKIMLSPSTARVISAVAVFLATPAVGPAYGQQANALLVDEIPPDSLAALISAVEQGDASAQYNLGVMYATGRGVPEDGTEAVRWYRAAAEQGDAEYCREKSGGTIAENRGCAHRSVAMA